MEWEYREPVRRHYPPLPPEGTSGRLGMEGLCFASLATSNYIRYECGLYANLKEYYPDIPLVVCALDAKTEKFFKAVGDPSLIVVTGEDVWGAECWRSLLSRMKRDERAFASKSALMEWIFLNGFKHTLFLDNDILLLDRIDDVLTMLKSYDTILAPARFTLENWRKSRTGNFNGGIFGFSNGHLRLVKIYKCLCFDRCLNLPMDNLFFEQKYLDQFIQYQNTGVIRDYGINVSGTDFDELKPHQDADGVWRVAGDVPIRLFHATSVTSKEFPLVKFKVNYDGEAFNSLLGKDGVSEPEEAGDRVTQKKKLFITSAIRGLGLGSAFTPLWKAFVSIAKWLQDVNRVISLEDFSLSERWRETFHKKKELLEKLRDNCRKG